MLAMEGKSGMVQPARILVVEDSLLVAMSLEHALVDAGYAVTVADTLTAARTATAEGAFYAALVDFHLPDGDSMALCGELRTAGTRVALVTGIDRSSAGPLAEFDEIFYKPVEERALLEWLSKL